MNNETYAPLAKALNENKEGNRDRQDSGSSSPAKWLIVVFVLVFFVAISIAPLFIVRPAIAATWPVSTSELSASLSFKQTYSAGDKSYAHSGIDIPASAGMQIVSPLAGTVCFTGAIPSGDSRIGSISSEKTMNAVSIKLENGRVITLMPFLSIVVREGQNITEGEKLGTVAESGDISNPATHVHMGYKQGNTYYDPMLLFSSVSVSEDSIREPQTEETPTALGVSNSAIADLASSITVEPEVFGTIETGAYEWKTKPQTEGEFSIERIIEPLILACYGQAEALTQALVTLSFELGVPLFLLIFMLLSAVAILITASVFLFIRFCLPQLRKLQAVRKSTLVHVRGG